MTADPHRMRTLWLCTVLHAFVHGYQLALVPLYILIRNDLHLGGAQEATLLVTAIGFASFLPSYPMGILADRLNRKMLLGIGLIINAAAFVGLGFARSLGVALLMAVMAGIGGSFFHPPGTALIARLFPEAPGKALGRMGIGAPCRHSHGRDRLASDGHCHAVAVFRSTARFPEKDRQRRSRRAAHVLQPRDAGHDPPGAWLQRFRAVGDSAPDRGLIPKPSQGADP